MAVVVLLLVLLQLLRPDNRRSHQHYDTIGAGLRP